MIWLRPSKYHPKLTATALMNLTNKFRVSAAVKKP
jgi:hypothetical protein